jgi:hypothetical protein
MGYGAGNGIGSFGTPVYDTIAIGTGAQANDTYGIAIGTNTQADQYGSVAIGADSGGNGAHATEQNQFVFGTQYHTYTTPGITSALSKSRQSGPLELVTSDANGNLATDGGDVFKTLDEHGSGIALAMSMENPDLVGAEAFGIAGNVATFQGAYAMSFSAMGVIGHDVFQEGDRVAVSASGGIGFPNGSGAAVAGARVGLQWTR